MPPQQQAIGAHQLQMPAESQSVVGRTIRADHTELVALRVCHDDVDGPFVLDHLYGCERDIQVIHNGWSSQVLRVPS
jgi:hypothetical protein